MDVLEDTAILGLDNNNVDVLKEQLRETRDRFTVGEVTRTDVAQAEASLAQGQAHRAQRCGDPAGRGRALPSIHRRSADQPCAGEAAREAAYRKHCPRRYRSRRSSIRRSAALCMASTRRNCR